MDGNDKAVSWASENSGVITLAKREYEILASKQARFDVLREVFESCGYIPDEVVRVILGVERKAVKANEN